MNLNFSPLKTAEDMRWDECSSEQHQYMFTEAVGQVENLLTEAMDG